jgi:enoyl-CoA hydratase/carnithine racemase
MLETVDHGKVRELRMARAPVNALDAALVDLLTTRLKQAEAESDAVVLSGQPNMFSAGLDVKALMHLDREAMAAFWESFIGLMGTIANSSIPVAAAVTGHAPAGGAVLCIASDYRVMCRGKSKIGLNETRVGLVLVPVIQDAMARLVGPSMSEKMIVQGTLVEPEAALQIGLVDALENDYESTVQHAINWCEGLLSLPRHAMLGSRAIARRDFRRAFAEPDVAGVDVFLESWFSDETQTLVENLFNRPRHRS